MQADTGVGAPQANDPSGEKKQREFDDGRAGVEI
jgi:hypothetical protein